MGIENRVGMAHEILEALALYGLNIITMEVNPPYISVNVEWPDIAWEEFKKYMMKNVKEIHDIIEIDMMDHEKREKELQTVINSMNDGLIATDEYGKISYFNKKAKELFNLQQSDISKDINQIIPMSLYNPQSDVRDKDGLELNKSIRGRKVNLICDIRVIKNGLGIKIGTLVILREMSSIKKLMHSINRPSMVTFEDIIGQSSAIKNAIMLAKSVASCDSSVMLLGESGTGKEMFARAIHMESKRRNGPFIAVNCAAVPDSLLESEFFGYERGAFTGAKTTGKQGLFELATDGTLFLDEIGDLPIHLQAKILRAIQEQKIWRIGGERSITINARIISATNRNLLEMIKQGTFREDLYYRLNVVPIGIPPLRERGEDVILFAKHFAQEIGKDMGKNDLCFTEEAINKLLIYTWPGNVRELQNVIERAAILTNKTIDAKHLMIDDKFKELNNDHLSCRYTSSRENSEPTFPVNLPKILQELECNYLEQACKKYNSYREIGKALGISHTTVVNKIKKFELCK